MAHHDVKLTLPTFELGKADLVIEIKSDDVKLGTLKISKGTIDYYPNNHQYGISLEWEQFDRIMRENGNQ